MNAAELLAIIAPHREMLKGMGCEIIECVEHPWVLYNGTQQQPDHAALIIEAVVRRELDGWADTQKQGRTVSVVTSGDYFVAVVRHRSHGWLIHETHNHGAPLAALLALLAWCHSQKGGK